MLNSQPAATVFHNGVPKLSRQTKATSEILLSLVVAAAGCNNSPPAIPPPDIDVDDLVTAAFSQYDRDSNGAIDRAELETAPSLSSSADRIDGNGDGAIAPEELKQFVQEQWIDLRGGLLRTRCEVTFNGRPLDGATVLFEPEQFMGGALHPASGTTQGGTARMDVADEHRPDSNAHGVQNGLYLVRITLKRGGEELIPAKYNTETTLGCEIAKRAPYQPGPVVFELTAR